MPNLPLLKRTTIMQLAMRGISFLGFLRKVVENVATFEEKLEDGQGPMLSEMRFSLSMAIYMAQRTQEEDILSSFPPIHYSSKSKSLWLWLWRIPKETVITKEGSWIELDFTHVELKKEMLEIKWDMHTKESIIANDQALLVGGSDYVYLLCSILRLLLCGWLRFTIVYGWIVDGCHTRIFLIFTTMI